ncbi:MAG: aquaporin [Longimicrobiales bacterium]
MPANRLQIAVAEFIGTFALTFIGILSISSELIVGTAGAPVSLIVVAFAHGLILAVMIAALGAVSGGHFNPAVTFGFLVTGRLDPVTAALYWVAQLLGALVAAYLLVFMTGVDSVLRGTPVLAENVGGGMGIILEAVATFFLVLVVFGTAVDERAPKYVYPLAIGFTLAAGIMALGPITGGALNPARAFGPALATGEFSRYWVYWFGPLLGGALAAMLHQMVLARQAAPKPSAPAE